MQKKIIELLTKTDGYVSGSEISEQLGVSRQAVWKAINGLKEQGYTIDSVTNRGYRLVTYPPHLNEPAIEKYLKTSVIGKNLIVLALSLFSGNGNRAVFATVCTQLFEIGRASCRERV